MAKAHTEIKEEREKKIKKKKQDKPKIRIDFISKQRRHNKTNKKKNTI